MSGSGMLDGVKQWYAGRCQAMVCKIVSGNGVHRNINTVDPPRDDLCRGMNTKFDLARHVILVMLKKSDYLF